MPTLQHLPREILHQVVDYIDLPTFANLKRTSRGLNACLQLSDLPPAQRIHFMQTADRLPHNEDLLACYWCCKMLPKTGFGLGQRRGKRRKSSVEPAVDRFCLDCAARHKLYGHMEAIVLKKGEDSRLMLCHHCSRYGTRYRHCGPARKAQEGSGGKDDAGWECWSDDRGIGTPALEALPEELIGRIVSQLAYPDAMSLASTCAQLRKKVDYSHVSVQSRFEFVTCRDSESPWRQKNAPWKDVGVCYACFRVLRTDMFTHEQVYLVETQRKIPYWQRRCRHCLYKMHANKGAKEALEKWRKQRPCEACGVLKHDDWVCQSLGCLQAEAYGEKDGADDIEHQGEKAIPSQKDHHSAPKRYRSPQWNRYSGRMFHEMPTPPPLWRRAVFEIRHERIGRHHRLPLHAPRLRKVKAGPGPLFRLQISSMVLHLECRGFTQAEIYSSF